MPVFTVRMTGWNPIDFQRHTAAISGAVSAFNRVSSGSANPKRILSATAVGNSLLDIVFYSRCALSPGREANALWYFSHDLAVNRGFHSYLTPKGKLLRRA